MKWLRVYFNYKFLFPGYANKIASKRRKAAVSFTMLVKTTFGVNTTTMQKTVYTCILLILTYKVPA